MSFRKDTKKAILPTNPFSAGTNPAKISRQTKSNIGENFQFAKKNRSRLETSRLCRQTGVLEQLRKKLNLQKKLDYGD